MKLIARTSRYFLIISLIVLTIGSVILVFALNTLLTHQLDENLEFTRHALKEELIGRETLDRQFEIMDEVVRLDPIADDVIISEYRDTFIWEEDEEEDELEEVEYRKYIYSEIIAGQNYRIELSHSKHEIEDLAVAISIFVAGFFLFFLVTLNVFNRFISRRIWKPFYHLIEQIKHYKLENDHGIEFVESNTEEFDILSHSIADMSTKLSADYDALKRFSENASHEIQTPLAIILAQTDLLLQQSDLNDKSAENISIIQRASKRISQLNRSLLLLAKIGNRQFTYQSRVSLDHLIRVELEALAPLIEHREIDLTVNLESTEIQCNSDLLTTLVQNVLSNSIKHNSDRGSIEVGLKDHKFVVRNTSALRFNGDTMSLFDRFGKGDPSSSSAGLGLAIVKEICDIYGWKVSYLVNGEMHVVSIAMHVSRPDSA